MKKKTKNEKTPKLKARDLAFQSSAGKKEAKTGACKPTLLTSRIERPTADPKRKG